MEEFKRKSVKEKIVLWIVFGIFAPRLSPQYHIIYILSKKYKKVNGVNGKTHGKAKLFSIKKNARKDVLHFYSAI